MISSYHIVRWPVLLMLLVGTGWSIRCECVEHQAPQTRIVGAHCCDDEAAPGTVPGDSETLGESSHGCVDSPIVLAKANPVRMGYYAHETVLLAAWTSSRLLLDAGSPVMAQACAGSFTPRAAAPPTDRFDLLRR